MKTEKTCEWIVQHIKHKKIKHSKYDIYKKLKTESSRINYKEAINYYTKEAIGDQKKKMKES